MQTISSLCVSAPVAGQVNGLVISVVPFAGFASWKDEEIIGPSMTSAAPAQSFVLAVAGILIVVSVPATVILPKKGLPVTVPASLPAF